jgi:hypothetical protein
LILYGYLSIGSRIDFLLETETLALKLVGHCWMDAAEYQGGGSDAASRLGGWWTGRLYLTSI